MSSEMRKSVTEAAREASRVLFESFGSKFIVDEKEEIGILKKGGIIHFQREGFRPKKDQVILHVQSGRKFSYVAGHPEYTADAFRYFEAEVSEIEEKEATPPKASPEGQS